MAKIKINENFRVEVEPDAPFGWRSYTNEQLTRILIEDCKSLEREIKRHVDGIGHIDVKYDTRQICSICERDYETDDYGCPQCCHEAIKEYEEQRVLELKTSLDGGK